MEDLIPETQKAIGDNSSLWMDQETLNTDFVFTTEGGLDHGFVLVRPCKDYGGDSL